MVLKSRGNPASILAQLRLEYHSRLLQEVLGYRSAGSEVLTNADGDSESSTQIALELAKRLARATGAAIGVRKVSGQTAGRLFTRETRGFLEKTFERLRHLRPGEFDFKTESPITVYDQYSHLAELQEKVGRDRTLRSALGSDYLITPDIVVFRDPVPDTTINEKTLLVAETEKGQQDLNGPEIARYTPLRKANNPTTPILHASVSCKWTIRSDRVQNTRAEFLNLIRNRKGKLPHVAAVTAEPLPTRLASLALGTGDLDCAYHFALPELMESTHAIKNEDQLEMLETLVNGRRLRDISDLPFDLVT